MAFMSNRYIGRPYNDTAGTIREVLINYQPSAHYTIASTIGAMPDTSFILFTGPGREEVQEQIHEVMEHIALEHSGYFELLNHGVKGSDIIENWMREMRIAGGDKFAVSGYYSPLLSRKNQLELRGETDKKEYMFLRDFLYLAALTHHYVNLKHRDYESVSAAQIEEEFRGRVELVSVNYVLNDCHLFNFSN